MHFVSDEGFIWTSRKGGIGGDDIWITTKRISGYEWQTRVNLGTNISTSSNEGMPSITSDRSLFVFHSDRPGGAGKYDIYFAKPTK
jgi:TolB protein